MSDFMEYAFALTTPTPIIAHILYRLFHTPSIDSIVGLGGFPHRKQVCVFVCQRNMHKFSHFQSIIFPVECIGLLNDIYS